MFTRRVTKIKKWLDKLDMDCHDNRMSIQHLKDVRSSDTYDIASLKDQLASLKEKFDVLLDVLELEEKHEPAKYVLHRKEAIKKGH